MRFDPQLVRFGGEELRISVRPRRFVCIRLEYGEYQRRFVEAWRISELKVGEVVINEKYVLVPFRKAIDLTNPKEWVAIDINEGNVTAVSSNPHILRIGHDFRTIHTTYFEIRKRI